MLSEDTAMLLHNRSQYFVATVLASLAIGAFADAKATDISVTGAAIEAGKLVVIGTTAAPNTRIRLEGRGAAAFNVTSGANGAFAFSVVYLPTDCIVSLQKLTLPATLGPASEAVVANCARGITARGDWNAAAEYLANDLVLRDGASWLATRDNRNSLPAAGADWQLFAAAAASDQPGADGSVGSGGEAVMRDPPDGPAGGDLTGTYPNPTIANFAVTGVKIAVGAVGASRIAVGAVTTPRIGNLAVTLIKIASDAVDSSKVVDNSLAAVDLAPDSVGPSEVANGAVDGAAVLDATLTQADLGQDSVGATEIADDSIDSGEIADNSLFAADIGAGAIGNSELASNAVTGAKVANNSLTASDILGANVSGSVNLSGVANGRCSQVTLSVGGAQVGEVAVIVTNFSIQNGVFLYANRVQAAGQVEASICNFSGGAMTPIVDGPVRIMTFG
jgi:hypothetical protein